MSLPRHFRDEEAQRVLEAIGHARMGVVELLVPQFHAAGLELLGQDARAPAQVELVPGAAVEEDGLHLAERVQELGHEAHRVMHQPAVPHFQLQTGRLGIERQLEVERLALLRRVRRRHRQDVDDGEVLTARLRLPGALLEILVPSLQPACLEQRARRLGEVRQVAILEVAVAGVAPQVREQLRVVAAHHQRAIASRAVPQHRPGGRLGQRAEGAVHEAQHVLHQVVAVAPDGVAVDPLAAAKRGPRIGEHADDGRNLTGGDERVQPLRHAERERRGVRPRAAAVGEGVQEVDDRVALIAVAVARGQVHRQLPAGGISQRVRLQGGRLHLARLKHSLHPVFLSGPCSRPGPRLLTKYLHHLLQVLPRLALLGGAAQQVGRVEGGHQLHALVLAPLPSQPGDGRGVPEQRLGGELPQRHDDLGLDGQQLRAKERLARGNLVGLRVPVARRPAFHHVADVDLVPAEAHRLDHLRQQLSRRADKGHTLDILVFPGPFPHEDEVRARVAHPEDDVLAPRAQLAAPAVAQLAADLIQRRPLALHDARQGARIARSLLRDVEEHPVACRRHRSTNGGGGGRDSSRRRRGGRGRLGPWRGRRGLDGLSGRHLRHGAARGQHGAQRCRALGG
ncbi:hypothetical protein STIAU_7007 [Stigmatella aurantiaca DW4/3-1]|uniref:Uncharacterized protein n=1 Tax=Stigmatella aurantiaca (strain DW4/3-1) TaxID=378806 RepID=Q08SM5_STIAD|nr:hypothetical protein STIAU_7007 [Stigmatella aurantiaca DW4/3-1]